MAAKKTTAKKTPAEKKPSLDIKDEMYWADKKRFDWLEGMDPDLAKTFSPLVAMKWFSVVEGPNSDYYIQMANDLVNVGFWELSKHPELQWKLMCAAGCGQPQRHGWVAMAHKRKVIGKLDQVLLKYHPQLSDDELSILKSKYTVETMKEYLRGMALSDVDIKPLIDDFKKTHG
jgi:hypothetical protein